MIKRFGYKTEIQFLNDSLVVENNNYLNKIVNIYIVHDLDYWPRSPFSTFTLKKCLLSATNVVKNTDKSKCVQRLQIAFDGPGLWNFGNELAGNVIIFDFDNSSSPHTDNRKNNFLLLGEGPTDDVNGSIDTENKSLVLILLKQRQDFT